MALFARALGVYERVVSAVLTLGRGLAAVCVAAMVAAILLQVWQRYVLDNALPWPEEFARAAMIWMTAFAAPTAYRWGGFVAIGMFRDALPTVLRRALTLALLLLAAAVLVKLFELALAFHDRGHRAATSALWAPRFGAGPDGWGFLGWVKVSSAWVYLAMPVCFGAMLAVNIELLAREIGRALAGEEAFPAPPAPLLVREAE